MAAAAAEILQPVEPELRTRYLQLPVMVRTAGLAATYAYLVAKSDATPLGRAYEAVADGIRSYLVDRGRLLPGVTQNDQVVPALAGLSAADYARASVEVESLAGWLRRLAEATQRANEPKPVRGPRQP